MKFLLIFLFLRVFLQTEQVPFVKINEDLEVNWTEFDFDCFCVGEKRGTDLFIRNVSDKDVNIDCVIPGCKCLKVISLDNIIRPSQTITLHIEFDSNSYLPGYFEQSVILCLSGYKNPFYFILRGQLIQ